MICIVTIKFYFYLLDEVLNGSTFTCIDTLDVYFYDEENKKWIGAES